MGRAAARQTVRLTLLQGGAGAAEAEEALVAEELAAGATLTEITIATAGIALIVIGLAALAYYLYTRAAADKAKKKVPTNPQLVVQCQVVPKKTNPDQKCPDAVLAKLQAEKQALADAVPPFDPKSPGTSSAKKLANVPCSRIKARLKALQALLAKRWEIQIECYGGNPDPSHQQAIQETENAIQNAKNLEAVNCAPGHPMSNL